MNKVNFDILKEIKKLKLPEKEFVVVGSAILAIKGIRNAKEIDDIDMVVTKQLFNTLKTNGWKSFPHIFENKECENLLSGIFEACREYWDNTDINFFKNNPDCVEEFDGIQFQSLKEFYKRKKAWGRPKDAEDLALIESYLISRGESFDSN